MGASDGCRKSVLMLMHPAGNVESRLLVGAQRFAESKRWDFSPVELKVSANGRIQFVRSPGGGSLEDLFALTRPDGILIALDAISERRVRNALEAASISAPIVHCGMVGAERGSCRAHDDPAAIATLAARELLSSGYGDYAFVHYSYDTPWTRARCDAFERLVVLAGRRFHRMPGLPPSTPEKESPVERLIPWIASLPRPCGVFAAADKSADAVLQACARLGFSVPADVAVVGVDDHAYICDHSSPTLSSIRRDLEGEGAAAAALLDEWMAAPDAPPPPSRLVPPVSLVRRNSTRFSWRRDSRVARAQEWIRTKACSGITVRDAVREMGVGRTTADRLFRSVAGHSILDEIHSVRLARACEKLRAGENPAVVAADCGYGSLLDFRRVFRNRIGIPLGQWIKSV